MRVLFLDLAAILQVAGPRNGPWEWAAIKTVMIYSSHSLRCPSSVEFAGGL